MKRVLSVQDLSCLGKCSLTVALPVLSAMGLSCTVLPTAVLSAHTGFPAPHIRSLTEDILPIARHWQSAGAAFEGISVGYLSDPEQAEAVEGVLELFPAPVLVDPVMGDGGRLYSGMGEAHVEAMRRLCRRGNILLPNLTEAAFLTGLPYREFPDASYLGELMEAMTAFGAKGVVITGVGKSKNYTGFAGTCGEMGFFSYEAQRIPRQLHGTGDLFSAVTLGALVQGKKLQQAAFLAARFTERVVKATEFPTPFGAEFETQLPWLALQCISGAEDTKEKETEFPGVNNP